MSVSRSIPLGLGAPSVREQHWRGSEGCKRPLLRLEPLLDWSPAMRSDCVRDPLPRFANCMLIWSLSTPVTGHQANHA
jgi:hypothetical protein